MTQDSLPVRLEDLLPDERTIEQMHEGAAEMLSKVVPQSIPERLAATLPMVPPEPLGNDPLAMRNWFDLVALLGEFESGATAKQLARRLGQEAYLKSLTRLLEHLAHRGELQRVCKGSVRYQAKPLVKVLPLVLRRFPGRLPEEQRDSFDLAVMAYQESPGADTWRAAVTTLVALVQAISGWPPVIAEEIECAPADWLRMTAGIEPPAYALDEGDPLVASLQAEVARLRAEVAELNGRLEHAAEDGRALRTEVADLKAHNLKLSEQVGELEALLSENGPRSLEEFLTGQGHGEIPTDIPEKEVAHARELVLSTKASRPVMLAIAAALGEVYRNPTGHQRLTTLSFKDHPYDSLWRARIGNYRIVYGVLHNKPYPIVVGVRGAVYEMAVHALRHKSLSRRDGPA